MSPRWPLCAVALAASLSLCAAVAKAGPLSDVAGGGIEPLGQPAAGAARRVSPTPEVPAEVALPPSASTGQRGVQVRTNLLSGPSLQAGPTVDYRPTPPHPQVPSVATRQDSSGPVELGGFVGYLFHDGAGDMPPSSLGVDLQFATDPAGASGSWLVQPGIDYTTPLAPALQFSTRLFSTYAPDNYGGTQFGLDRSRPMRSSNSDLGFQDVGVGVGLGYAFTDSWNLQTEARYQRSLGSTEPDNQGAYPAHQFFGGVMLDYKF